MRFLDGPFQFTLIHFGFSFLVIIIIIIIQNAKTEPASRESFPQKNLLDVVFLCRRGGVAALICPQLRENKFWRRAKVA